MDRRGVATDRGLQLGRRGSGVVPRVDEHPAEDRQAALVVVMLPRLQQKLVRNPGSIGQLLHPPGIPNGHAGRRRQGERGPAAGSHHRRLAAEQTGNLLSRAQQQPLHLDVMAIGRGHRLLHSGGKARSAQNGLVTGGIDNRGGPEVAVELCRIHPDLLHG